MKVKIHEINPDNNFLSSEPAKTLVELSKITKFELPDEIIIKKSSRLIISPYEYLGNTDLNILRDSSWGGDLNLRSWASVSKIVDYLSAFDEVLLLGALESLGEIRPLIKALRIWMMKRCVRKAIFLSNLNSARYKSFREWSQEGAKRLFECSGFKVLEDEIGITINCSKDYYGRFLSANNLPQHSVRHIVITNEHPDYRITGGIGSYVKESTRLYGDNSAVLIVDDNDNINREIIENNKWLSLQKLIGEEKYSKLLGYDFNNSAAGILEAVYQILFLYDEIKSIEGSDYGHLNLSRVIQAKKAGLLPGDLQLITVCHGSNIYVDNASGRYPSKMNIPVIQKEVYSIVNSDVTIFLTDFLKNLYAGYGIESQNPVKHRLPINLSYYDKLNIKEPDDFSDIKNIYYIGKLSRMKGGDRFLSIIANLAKSGDNYNVICASTYTSPEQEIQDSLMLISKYPNVKLNIRPYRRDELLIELNNRAKDSIAIIPYPADNHPNVILELMLTGMDFIATNSGGIPELIPQKDHFITESDCESIIYKFEDISKNRNKRFEIVKINRVSYLEQQEVINKTYSIDRLESLTPRSVKYSEINKTQTVSVIVPCYNTKFAYIKELALSLDNQSISASEVLFVNDGSSLKDYSERLNNVIKQQGYRFKYRILNKPNGGLASARNFGLKNAKSKYVVTVDSDDVVNNYFLEELVAAISAVDDKSVIGVTPFLNAFYDGEDVTRVESFHYEYMPYGSNLATAFMPHNTYGSAAAIFDRRKLLDATGGWDESSKSMFEDWALYVRLDSLGYKVNVVPTANYFYRVRPNSMLRTYDNKEGYKRLISNYLIASKYESYLLFSQLFNYYEFNLETSQTKCSYLQETFGTYDTRHISKLVKFSRLLSYYDRVAPNVVKRLVYYTYITPYRILKKMYRVFR